MKWMAFVSVLILSFSYSLAAETPLEVSVAVKGYLWSEPGYSWFDCRPQDKGFNSTTAEGRAALKRYQQSDVKKACQSGKSDLIDSGEALDVVSEHGQPVTKIITTRKHDGYEAVKYYKVSNPETGHTGWMSEKYLQTPKPKKFQAPPVKVGESKPSLPCPDEIKSSGSSPAKIEILRRSANDIATAASKMPTGSIKNEKELDRFTCLYRSSNVSIPQLKQLLPKVKKATAAAQTAFGVPAPVLRCMMLNESGLDGKARSSANTRGYAQVRETTVEYLMELAKRPELAAKLEAYKKAEPSADLNKNAVFYHSTVDSSVAAMALYLSHMKQEFIAGNCRDCSSPANEINRKEVFLLVTGYNAGHTLIKPATQRRTSDFYISGPPETRGYVLRMDRCLTGGHETSFKEQPKILAEKNRERRKLIAELRSNRRQRSSRKGPANDDVESRSEREEAYLQDLIAKNASNEYESRQRECNDAFPL